MAEIDPRCWQRNAPSADQLGRSDGAGFATRTGCLTEESYEYRGSEPLEASRYTSEEFAQARTREDVAPCLAVCRARRGYSRSRAIISCSKMPGAPGWSRGRTTARSRPCTMSACIAAASCGPRTAPRTNSPARSTALPGTRTAALQGNPCAWDFEHLKAERYGAARSRSRALGRLYLPARGSRRAEPRGISRARSPIISNAGGMRNARR